MPKYKFNINHRYSLLSRNIEWKHVYQHVEQYGIPMRTMQNDKAIEVGSDQDLPSERLLIYAKVFGCTIEDLINYKVKVKAIAQL